MTIWPARLSKDGTKVLCGRTVDGRQNCTAVLAVVQMPDDPSLPFQGFYKPDGPSLLFQGFYDTAGPQGPDEAFSGGPTSLRITTHAAKKLARGQTPTRHRPNDAHEDGGPGLTRATLNPDGTGFTQNWRPVVVPCIYGHISKVDKGTLKPRLKS
jgi:hypothetical protein